MKKVLNVLGILGSIVLTFLLTILIFVYAVTLNIKSIVSKNGITSTLKKIDIVEALKNAEDGVMWEDFLGLAETLNLTEEQFEQILNSDKVKEEIGSYIGDIVGALTNDKNATLTKERIERLLNVAVDEYNKVSNIKISDSEREEIINSFDEEMIANMNEEFSSVNLKDTVPSESVKYIDFVDNLLFGNLTLTMFFSIIGIIVLIALFRFSYYKWMPYVKSSLIIVGILMVLIGIFISIVPMPDMEMLLPLKNILVTNVFISSVIIFILAIILGVGKKLLIKFLDNKKQSASEIIDDKAVEVKDEISSEKEKKETKIDKKKIIIIVIVLLILLLLILFLILGLNRGYTITFDTNGGTTVPSIEVKNGEIVTMPENPVKEGYTFVGWTNEDGKIFSEGSKFNEDVTLKAEWISDEADIITIEYDSDGGSTINDIPVEKGNNILLPTNPTKEGYTFVAWLDNNGNIVTDNLVLTKNIKLKAMWLAEKAKTVTVKYNTDGGNNVGNILLEKGKLILLPINPTKSGYVFAGWVDEDGKEITKDTVISKNITIKAKWKKGYSCPSGCTPIGDGSKCTITSTKEMSIVSSCPSGYTKAGNKCTKTETITCTSN